MNGFRLRLSVCAACFLLGGMLATEAVRAEAMTDTAVLVFGAEDAPLTKRLEAELRALGLHVLVAAAQDISLSELAGRAHAAGVALALSTAETSEGVELRLVDRVTGKTLLREVLERDLSSTDPDALIALRAVELLRASLLELELTHPPRGEVAATNALRETIRRAVAQVERAEPQPAPTVVNTLEQSVVAGLRASVFTHLGETRPESGVSADLLWQPTAKVAVGVWGAIPLGSVDVSAAEGAADLRSHVFGTGLRFAPLSLEERLQPTFGAGASVLWLSVTGTRSRSDLVLASEELVAVGPYAAVGCGLRIAGALTLRSEIRAVVAFPKPVIEFADREVTSLGRPFLMATFGLEYRAVVSASRD
jgi:hypothetical protein